MHIRTLVLLLGCSLAASNAFAEKRAIVPKEFAAGPGATGLPYSPGILIDGTLYVAGQVGRDLKTGQIPTDFESEVHNALDNAGLVLKAARPARTTVGVSKLVGPARIEITITARK